MTLAMEHILVASAAMLTVGMVGLLVRRNAIVMFMSIELVLNAANLNLIGFSRFLPDPVGQVFVIFVIVIAAAEVAVALAIVLSMYRLMKTVELDRADALKG